MGNVVLVHGAWCDGSSRQGVIAPLRARGHRVLAVQNPQAWAADRMGAERVDLASSHASPVTHAGDVAAAIAGVLER